MTKLRGALIGAGYFARFHYEAWTRIADVEMVACCDLSEEKARALMEQFGVARYDTDWREMIERERPDFIDIITPPETHEEIVSFAAQRGIDIVCQKPLAPSVEAARRIVEAATVGGVRLMVHENFRWQPWYRQIKQIQNAGTIGNFTHIHMLTRTGDGWGEDAYLERQPFFRKYPRLLLYETGVHFIDTFRYLLGEVVEVYAHIRRLNPVIQGEDAGQLFLRFASGASAIWDANRYNETECEQPRFTFGDLRVDGTAGHLTMNGEATMRLKPLGQPAHEVEYEHENRNFGGDCVYRLQRHFIDCLLSGDPFEASAADYLTNSLIVNAAYESATEGKIVRL